MNSDGPDLRDLLSLGVTLASCVLVGFGLGWAVDQPFRTFPGFALAGLGLGIVAACALIYRQFKKFL